MLISIQIVQLILNLFIAECSFVFQACLSHHADRKKVEKQRLVSKVMNERSHRVYTSVEK